MRKLICVFVCITMAMISFAGCANEPDIVDNDAENTQATDAGNEYALYSNGNYYPVSNSFLVGGIFENLEMEYILPDDPYPAQNWYTGQGLFIKANIIKPDDPEGEAIWYINAVEEGKTPRNVGIGDNRTEIIEAYDNELFIEKDWVYDSSSKEPEFDEVYIYAPPSDGTTLYLAFFMNKGKVVRIEIADGFELRPYDPGQ